jgi:hypothetical protein
MVGGVFLISLLFLVSFITAEAWMSLTAARTTGRPLR